MRAMNETVLPSIKLHTDSVESTEALAFACAQALSPGSILALTGDLGAGKTCFSRGFARGWGVPEEIPVTSPTFTLLNIYPGRSPLYHLDLYRLQGEDDLEAIGFYDLFDGEGIVLMEWADRIPAAWGDRYLHVALQGEGDTRTVILEGGCWAAGAWESLQKALGDWVSPE